MQFSTAITEGLTFLNKAQVDFKKRNVETSIQTMSKIESTRNSKQNKRSGLSSDQHLCGYGTHRTFYFSALPRLIDLEYFPQVNQTTQLDGAKDDKAQADMK